MLHTVDCALYRATSACYTQVTVCFTEAHLYMLHTGEGALYRGTSVHVTHSDCALYRQTSLHVIQVTVHFRDILYMLHTQLELLKSYNELQFTSLVFTSLFV